MWPVRDSGFVDARRCQCRVARADRGTASGLHKISAAANASRSNGKPRIRPDLGGVTLAVRHRTDIPLRTDQHELPPPTRSHAQRLYGKRGEACAADETHVTFCVMQARHWIPQAKGGGDQYQNVQVPCSGYNLRQDGAL